MSIAYGYCTTSKSDPQRLFLQIGQEAFNDSFCLGARDINRIDSQRSKHRYFCYDLYASTFASIDIEAK